MDFSAICRTCIKSYNSIDLNPIFLSEDVHERFSSAFFSCSGVEVKLKDGLPQNMCTACMKQFNNTLKFRKQCKLAETQLLKIKAELDSKNSSIIKTEQNSIQITDGHPLTQNCLTTRNKVDVKNCSNVTSVTSGNRTINIKYEPVEIDIAEDRPINKIIKENVSSISLIKSNKDTELNAEDNSGTDYYENNIKIEKTVYQNVQEFTCDIYTRRPQISNDTEQKSSHITETLSDSIITEEKTIEIPYIVTESDTKKTTRVVCKLCQKELSIRSIDSHMMRRHPGADERKVKCELCDKYVMREKLNRHRVLMHGIVGVQCGYCKSEFNSKEALVDHVTTCTAKKRKRKVNDSGRALAECDICKMTMQRASINKHKAVKHAGLRPVCEHCGKSFGNKFRLNEHYRAKHGYEKFQCSYCDFKSAGIMAMRNHERRHRGEKPFVCETCGAKFHAAYLLMQHKHSHKTEKLVKCDLCPAIFKANNNLHMHKLTCHSKSYYSCTLCARSYKCRYYAVKHVRLAHHASEAPEVIKLMNQ